MTITYYTTGRFHLLDDAVAMHKRGHDVRFYTLEPESRCRLFGLPPECHRPILPGALYRGIQVAEYGLSRVSKWMCRAFDRLLTAYIDCVGQRIVDKTDVFIGLSGMCPETAMVAKRRGALVVCSHGSTYPDHQMKVMRRLPNPIYLTEEHYHNTYAQLEQADLIDLPSLQAAETFPPRLQGNIRVTPYGADPNVFQWTPAPKTRTIITAGTWSYRKGSDRLVAAWLPLADEGWRLLHVGCVEDVPLPRHPLFEHHAFVDQFRLPEFYAKADVFCLLSREDGLSIVIPQAMLSGLPVVCTRATGGYEFAPLIYPTFGGETDARAAIIAACIQKREPMHPATRRMMSWDYRAERMESWLRTKMFC